MTSLFPPFNRRSSFRKQPYFFEAGRGVNYKSTGYNPALNLDFTSGVLDSRITFSRASNATLTDSTGKITFAPNNLLLNSATLSTQTVSTGFNAGDRFVLSFSGTGSVAISGGYTGTLAGTGVSDRVSLSFSTTTTSLTFTVTGSVTSAQLEAVTYQTTPSTYNATTTAAYYGPRFDYDPVTLAAKGLLIEEARTNLLTYSQQFDNAAWTKEASTVSADSTTAPNGTATADSVIETATTAVHAISQTLTVAATPYVFSVYLKKGIGATAPNWVQLTFGGTSFGQANFNLSTGAIGFTLGATATISSAGSGWYRCSIIATPTAGSLSGQVVFTNNADTSTRRPSYAGATTSDVYIWGAQLEAGTFATSYIPTAAASVARSADLASMTGTNFSSWFNQGPANLVLQSQTFDNASWTKLNSSISANATTAPDGTLTADKLIEDTATSQHLVLPTSFITITSGSLYTLSVYAKAAERTLIYLRDNGSSNTGAFFNLSSGTVYSPEANVVATAVTSVGNGWYRCSVSYVAAAATANTQVRLVSTGTTTSYTGDGTSGVFLWGAQLELGSTATTYIPTTTAPVASPPAVGTFVAKADAYSATAYSPLAVARLSSTAIQNRIDLSTNGTTATLAPRITVTVANVTQADLSATVPAMSPNTAYTFAGAFATNDFISASQGVLSTNDTSGAVPAPDILDIGNRTNPTLQLNGHLQYLRYYRTRLPNAQLQVLTS